MLNDLRHALRCLSRRPGFTAVAVVTIALGTGAATALFSAVNGLLLEPLPLREPERLVEIVPQREEVFSETHAVSYPQLQALRDAQTTLAGVAAVTGADVNLRFGGRVEEVEIRYVTGNYFGLLGIRPAFGRLIRVADDRRGAPTAGVVLSHRFWRTRFGADSSVVGRSVSINGRPVVIMGVINESFAGTSISPPKPLWAPLSLEPRLDSESDTYSPNAYGLALVGRLRDNIAFDQARTRLDALLPRISEEVPTPDIVAFVGANLRKMSRIDAANEGPLLRSITLLGIATALILLIGGLNVGGMLLARAASRGREMAVRATLGAGRRRLVRQSLTEAIVLFLAGGAGGVLLAFWLTDLIEAFRWGNPVVLDLGLDLRVLGFALALSLVTGLVFGLLPALRTARPSLVSSLQDGGSGAGARRGVRLRRGLVVGQIAMSLVLLVGAGLFGRTLANAFTIDPGFDPDRVWTAPVDVQRLRYSEPRARQLYGRLTERVRRVPGVAAAAIGSEVPLGPGANDLLRVRPVNAPESEEIEVHATMVGSAFFDVLRMRILRGRGFTEEDDVGAPRVVVVNQAFAERVWPGHNPVGQRLRQTFSARVMMNGLDEPTNTTYRVVGVVANANHRSLREVPEPRVFTPLAQNYRANVALAIRVRDDADESAVASAAREAMHAVAPMLPVDVRPLDRNIADQFQAQRAGAALTSVFALLGLLLAAVGLYGVMAYTVNARTREIGVRMALGAGRRSVLRGVLGRGVILTLIGLAIGLAFAFWATRLLAGLLFGVEPLDPATFAAAAVVLLGVAALAAYIPARRAAAVDPMDALRYE